MRLWIDGNVLVEFLAKGETARYVDAFGAAGIASLGGTLRDLEAKLAVALSQTFTPDVLAEALGSDWQEVQV